MHDTAIRQLAKPHKHGPRGQYNQDVDMTPSGLVNEMKRITVTPEGCSVRDFLDIYVHESSAAAEEWRADLLNFCLVAWVKHCYTGGPEGAAQLRAEVKQKWDKFCDSVDRLPDIDEENYVTP